MKESEESGSSPGRVANPPPGSYFAVALAFGLSLCVLTYLHYELFILFIPSLPRKHRYRELGKGGARWWGKSEPGKCCKSGILDVVSVINVSGQIKTKTAPEWEKPKI